MTGQTYNILQLIIKKKRCTNVYENWKAYIQVKKGWQNCMFQVIAENIRGTPTILCRNMEVKSK